MRTRRHQIHLAASKVHKWLALVIGAQLLIWFASGALMSWWPIDQIHGDHLIDRTAVTSLPGDIALADPHRYLVSAGEPVERVTLRMLQGRAVAETVSGKHVRLYDAVTGTPLPPVDARLASAIAAAAWKGPATPTSASSVTSASTEYRGPLPAWRIAFADADKTSVFVAADTGQITAVRTGTWRLYDFVWGLHIMDWQDHENFNSWWLVSFAIAGLVLGLAGLVLLAMRWPFRRRRRALP